MNNQRIFLLILVTSLLLGLMISIPAYATNEAPWPVVIEFTMLFLVLPKLLIEYGLIKYLTKSSVKRTIVIDIVMNLGALFLGTGLLIIFLRVLYLGFEFLKVKIYIPVWTNIGLVLLLFSAILVYVLIEKFTIEKVFKNPIGKKGFWWLVFTWFISIGLFYTLSTCLGSLLV